MVMTKDAAGETAATRRTAPAYCKDGCRCALWDDATREPEGVTTKDASEEAKPREFHPDPTVLSYAEACALLGGVQTGLGRMLGLAPEMLGRRHAVINAHHRAAAALESYESFIAEGTHTNIVARACHAEATRTARPDGPPTWLRFARWPAIVLIGTFDVWFFQQYFINIGYSGRGEDPGAVQKLIALIPGISVVLMILLAASLVGDVSRAGRDDTTRRRRFRPGRTVGRLVAVAYLALVVTVIGYFAYLRAYEAFFPRTHRHIATGDQIILVSALIGLLTLTSILMKIKGDDPEADALLVARWRRRFSNRRHDRVRAEARDAVTAHGSAYSDLRAIRDEGLGTFRDAVIEAYRHGILEPRGQHRPAREAPPRFTLPATIQNQANGDPRSAAAREYALLTDASLIDGAGPLLPEFENIRQPRPSLGPLPEVCRVLAEYPADQLCERWVALDRRLADEIKALTQP
jgi:hypothetical protein